MNGSCDAVGRWRVLEAQSGAQDAEVIPIDGATVDQIIDYCKKHNIPCKVVVVGGWLDERKYGYGARLPEMPKHTDLRQEFDDSEELPDGSTLYRQGKIIQVWHPDGDHETWTLRSEDEAAQHFEELKVRWAEEPVGARESVASAEFNSIEPGDLVTIITPQGQERTGRAVMRGPGWQAGRTYGPRCPTPGDAAAGGKGVPPIAALLASREPCGDRQPSTAVPTVTRLVPAR